MTQKVKGVISKAGIVMLAVTALFGIVSNRTIKYMDLRAERIECLEEATAQNTKDIQTIKDTMLTEQKLEKILKSNNAELINALFEKGYIRAK